MPLGAMKLGAMGPNYGIVSALMCSISAGIFGGVAADEWKMFEENIAPNWESCVAAATNSSHVRSALPSRSMAIQWLWQLVALLAQNTRPIN